MDGLMPEEEIMDFGAFTVFAILIFSWGALWPFIYARLEGKRFVKVPIGDDLPQ